VYFACYRTGNGEAFLIRIPISSYLRAAQQRALTATKFSSYSKGAFIHARMRYNFYPTRYADRRISFERSGCFEVHSDFEVRHPIVTTNSWTLGRKLNLRNGKWTQASNLSCRNKWRWDRSTSDADAGRYRDANRSRSFHNVAGKEPWQRYARISAPSPSLWRDFLSAEREGEGEEKAREIENGRRVAERRNHPRAALRIDSKPGSRVLVSKRLFPNNIPYL
jgi:hypothetical protein